MQTGTRVSAAGHGAIIFLALVGLPWFGPREREAIRVTEVSFVSEAEFAEAQSAARDAVRTPEAPPVQPAHRPAPAEPAPPPEPAAEAEPDLPQPAAPEDIAALEPPAPAPEQVTPRVETLAPPTAALPPRARPIDRVAPERTPAPPEDVRPIAVPEPDTRPEPAAEAEEPAPERTPAAAPEATPEPVAEPTPPATLALETAGRPVPRRGNVAPRPSPQSEAVLAAVQAQQRRASQATPPTPATPATPPSVTAPSAPSETEAAETSLPVGPPLTMGERDGLRVAVQRCWNMPAGLRDAQELKVTLAAELAADGSIISSSIRLIEPRQAPDARFQSAFDAGRRALIRCSPYTDLPREKYAQWRNIEVVFNPEGMVSW